MPAQIKNITGKLNLDTAPAMMPEGDFADAFNIVRDAIGQGQDKVVSNMIGNTATTVVLPGATTKTIGSFPDPVRNRIYYMDWNSDGINTIYYYDNTTAVTTALLRDILDTDGEQILNFDPSFRINHINIIYRDEGDLLYFTDAKNEPFELNIGALQSGVYGGVVLKSYIQAAKATSIKPPYVIYENNDSVTVNNLRKKLFRFKERLVYRDLSKSVTSSQSEIPIPVNYTYTYIDTDPTKNSCIFIVLQTGTADVRTIEVIAMQSLGDVMSDAFLIDTLDKDVLNIPDNDVYLYRFFNDKAYNYIDVQESIQLYDYVPLIANTQEAPNGNYLAYAGITEGYPLLTPIIATDSLPASSLYSPLTELLYAFGIAEDYTKIVVAGIPSVGDEFVIKMQDGVSTDSIEYDVVNGDTIASILSGIAADAVSFGFTITTTAANYIVIHKTGTSLENFYINGGLHYKNIVIGTGFQFTSSHTIDIFGTNNLQYFPVGQTLQFTNAVTNTGVYTIVSAVVIVTMGVPNMTIIVKESVSNESVGAPAQIEFVNSNNIPPISLPAYDWKSKYAFGLVYFDEKERTNGVVYPIDFSISTINYEQSDSPIFNEVLIPEISISIESRPPLWASKYSLVRTKNLSKSNFVQWISDRTFKDLTASNIGYQYAYISIASLNQFIADNPSAKILAYDFTPNDRIRFFKRFSTDGTTANIYDDKDFEIQDSLLNPVINGVQQQGQILKIILPNTDADFDFGGQDYANYFIEIYTPALNVENNLNVYYEFGEMYAIGNAGTSNAFHYGMLTNQSTDLVSPATFLLTKGDDYFRYRSIPVGNEIKYNPVTGNIVGNTVDTIPLTLTSQSFNDENYVATSFPTNSTAGPTTQIVQVLTASPYKVSFRISGYITFTVVSISGGYTGFDITSYLYPHTGGFSSLVNLVNDTSTLTVGQTYTFQLNGVVNLGKTAAENLVIAIGMDTTTTFNVLAGQIVLNQVTNISEQGIIDPNFSDFFASKVNANGRAYIHDPNAKQTYFPTLIRFSEAYQDGTNINGLPRFYPLNFDEYNRAKGAVKKLFVDGQFLHVFQEFDIGLVPIFQQVVTDQANNPLQTQSIKLLNNIQYPYQGKYGMTFPESFAYNKYAKYGVDGNKKVVWRLSQDGIIPISILYECNAFFQEKLTAYNINLNNGIPPPDNIYKGNPTVYGGFDYYTNKYIVSLEEINRYYYDDLATENNIILGTEDGDDIVLYQLVVYDLDTEDNNDLITENNNNIILQETPFFVFHQDPFTLTFWETREENEGFESKTNYYPENIVSLGSLLGTFKSGKLWLHNNTNAYCNFYGVQYFPSITMVFNKDAVIKKTFNTLSYKANNFWTSPVVGDIQSGTPNQETGLPQISQLIEQDMSLQEGQFDMAFLRDANSMADAREGLVNGDVLKSNYLIVKLTYQNSDFNFLYLPYINWSLSPRNL